MNNCSSKTDSTSKFVKIIGNTPSITKNKDTLLSFVEGNLSNFSQAITDYDVKSFVLGPSGGTGSTTLVNQDMNFIMINATWPSTALESEKQLELQLSDFDYVDVFTGATGTIGSAGTVVTGVTTSFTGFSAGDRIESGGQIRTINNITTDTLLTTTVAFSPAISTGATFSTVAVSSTLGATALSTEKIPMKDVFMINTSDTHKHLQLNNVSTTHSVTINLLTAK